MNINTQFTNNAATTLASGITNSATSLTVATGTGTLFPTITAPQFFIATLENVAGTVREIVKVTARSGDTFTIVRGQEGTTAQSFSTADKVELRLTAAGIDAIIGSTGATDVTSATDVTLTNSSTQIQRINMTTSGKYVILPDARTLPAGVTVFQITSLGQYPFAVKDYDGNIISSAGVGVYTLFNNTTSAGNWGLFLAEVTSTSTILASSYIRFCLLSSTSFVCTYSNLSGTTYSIYAVAGTISGTTATFGTPVLVQTITLDTTYQYNALGGIAKTSSTSAVISSTFTASGTTEYCRVWAISVSGTTVTVGSPTNAYSVSAQAGFLTSSIYTLDGTKAVLCMGNTNGNIIKAWIVTTSGTTLTLGTANTLPTTEAFRASQGCGPIATDKFYWSSLAGNLYIFSVSGTTITRGTLYNAGATDLATIGLPYPVIVSSTQFIQNKTVVTYSGTTVSSVSTNNNAVVSGSPARISNYLYTPTARQTISGTTVFPSLYVGTSTVTLDIRDYQVLNSTTLIGAGYNTSGYLTVAFTKVL